MSLDERSKWFILQSKIQEKRIVRAFEIFRDAGIEPILFKGYAIARAYPSDRHREFYDIDLAVSFDVYEKAQMLWNRHDVKILNVDLHRGFRHLDLVEWDKIFANSKIIKLADASIRVLSDEDHLRVLCVHWLTDGGENKQKLWDIYYLISQRSKDFDWEKCFDTVDSKRRLWIIYTIGLAHKYLQLDLEGFPFEQEAKNLPFWLTRQIEKIWSRKYPFIPLDACYRDREMFLYQLKLRFPPNPIMATIGVNGRFDARTRIPYQIKYFFKRATPSLKSYIKSFRLSQKQNEFNEKTDTGN